MVYEQYQNFAADKKVLQAMGKALGIKRPCFIDSMTSRRMTINVGPLYSSKFETVKKKREEANCILDYRYQNTAYYLRYNDNARNELLREIKELFPHAHIIRFKHNDESGARMPVNIPYEDWFQFAEKSGNPFTEYTAQDIQTYLEKAEEKIEKTLKEQFGLEYASIKFALGSVEMNLHFSDLYLPENNPHLLDKYDVYPDGGYCKTLLYTDKNKRFVREQLQSIFSELEVFDFATSGVVEAAKSSSSSKFGLRAECFCPLENIL